MIAFLIKASAVIGATWLFYKIFLQKESFFALNRFFLLASLLVAFVIPILNIPQLIDHQGLFNDLLVRIRLLEEASMNADTFSSQILGNSETLISESDTANTAPLVEKQSFNWFTVILTTYLIGVCILGLRFLYQLGSLFLYVKRAENKHYNLDTVIIHTDRNLAPCSFFKYIFINPTDYKADTCQQILAHEKIHAQYGHSYDLLLAKLATILLWFNPFIWLFRRDLEQNIEYQTDHILLSDEAQSMESYQMSLLQVAAPGKNIGLTTNYNQSLLTQRIIMMKAKKSTQRSLWKYTLLIPLFLGILLVLNDPIKLNAQVNELQPVSVQELKQSYERIYLVINADTKLELLQEIKELLREYEVSFTWEDVKLEKGKLYSINAEMSCPDEFTGGAGVKDLGMPMKHSLVFYNEMKKGGGAGAGGISKNMSEYGTEIVTNNLNGLLIIDIDGKMHVRGAVNLP